MGADGGTIPRRIELVRTRQKPEQKDRVSERFFKWKHCALSQAALEKPIVACELGNLYSKSSVLEALLSKEDRPAAVAHLRGLKDIRVLNLTEVTGSSEAPAKGDSYIDTQSAPYMCPVVGLEMNGKYRFVTLWTCGCVLSERALKMVRGDQCPRCSAPWLQQDVVVLNPTDDDLTRMVDNMEARRARTKDQKKASKNKLTTDADVATASSSTSTSAEPQPKKPKLAKMTHSAGKETPAPSINLPNSGKLVDPAFAKTSSSYSISKDGEKTEVYKSLFTTHETALKQPKAHWVTYNPLFN